MAERAEEFESRQGGLRFARKQSKVWGMQVVSLVILEISRQLQSDS